MDIDYNKLRSDLIDYLGTASSYNPMVIIDIMDVQKATNSELENYAIMYGFNLDNYQKGSSYTRYKIL